MFGDPFQNKRSPGVNLSTTTASSSSALLSSVRAERLAREDRRRQDLAALRIQSAWRGRREAGKVKRKLLERLEGGESEGVEERARSLIVLFRDGVGVGDAEEVRRRGRLLEAWCLERREVDGWLGSREVLRRGLLIGTPDVGAPRYLAPLRSSSDYIVVIAVLCTRILQTIALDPR